MKDFLTRKNKKEELLGSGEKQDLIDLPGPTGLKLLKSGKKSWLKWLIISLVAVVILIIGGMFAGYTWYKDALKPKSTETTRVTVEVVEGTSVNAVIEDLEAKGVIKSALAMLIFTKLNNNAHFQAGTYTLSPNQSVQEIVEWLNTGRVDSLKVTILPGKTVKEIKAELVQAGYAQEEVDAAFEKTYSHPVLSSRPSNAGLEGYIYPETYFMTVDSTVEELLNRAFDQLHNAIKDGGYEAKLKAKGLSLYEGMTLASIVSKEVVTQQDRKQVAQVFLKRLSEDMPLGSDVTYEYAAKEMGVEASPSLDSPYNTRIHKGLPPGPIANFTLDVLDAVVNPASGDFLFFVSGDDGTTYFSKTQEEHEANTRKYCTKLCFGN